MAIYCKIQHFYLFLGISSIIFISCASTARADDCDSILDQGIRNTYQALNNADLRSAFRNAFCSNNTTDTKGSSGGGLNVTIPIANVPVKLGGNYNTAKASTNSSGTCSDVNGSMSADTYSAVLQQVADPGIVAAWTECKKVSGGLFVNGKLNGSTLSLEFRFRTSGNVTTTTIIGDPQISGADCKAIVKDGTVISNSQIYESCKRYGNEPVTVLVNSTFNGATFYLPATPEISAPPTPAPAPATIVVPPPPVTGHPLPSMIAGQPPLFPPSGMSWCTVSPSELPPGTPKTSCYTPISSGSCTCPKFAQGNPDPIGVYNGTVVE